MFEATHTILSRPPEPPEDRISVWFIIQHQRKGWLRKESTAGQLDKALAFQRKSVLDNPKKCTLFVSSPHSKESWATQVALVATLETVVCYEDTESAHMGHKPGLACTVAHERCVQGDVKVLWGRLLTLSTQVTGNKIRPHQR